jgi:hypothetical protein
MYPCALAKPESKANEQRVSDFFMMVLIFL